jgi:hypothetical protein
MPETLQSIMGSVQPQAKKKLRKVGDHYEDEQGNKFSDEAGTQPVQDKTAASAMDVKAEAPIASAMDSATTGTDEYKAVRDAYTSGDYQKAYDLSAGKMKDPKYSGDPNWKQLFKRIQVALNLG